MPSKHLVFGVQHYSFFTLFCHWTFSNRKRLHILLSAGVAILKEDHISIAQSVVQNHSACPVCIVIGETADTYNESGKSMLDKDTIEYRIGDSVITVRRYFSRERTRKHLLQEIIADRQAVCYNSSGNTAVVPIQKEGS